MVRFGQIGLRFCHRGLGIVQRNLVGHRVEGKNQTSRRYELIVIRAYFL